MNALLNAPRQWRTLLALVGLVGGLPLWGWAQTSQAQTLKLDPDFGPSCTVTKGTVLTAAAFGPNGQVIVAGQFEALQGRPLNGLARLKPDGSLEPSFDPGAGLPLGTAAPLAQVLVVQADGKLLVAGAFAQLGGACRSGIGRLEADGRLDAGFAPQVAGAHFTAVYCLDIQPDGKLLIGGNFDSIGGVSRRGVARLNPDGSLDGSFNPGQGLEDELAAVFDLVLQSDGCVVIGGSFTAVDGVACNSIARLNPDGSLDTSFDPGKAAGGNTPYVAELALQPDGRILVAGGFDQFNEVRCAGLARLEPSGQLDAGFDAGSGPAGGSAEIGELVALPEGKTLVVGDFTSFGDCSRNGIVRLNADGSVDVSFDPGAGLQRTSGGEGWANAALLQADGQIIVVGAFDSVGGLRRHHLARLEDDGRVDRSYSSSEALVELGGGVNVLLPQPDGKLIVGGDFERVDGRARHGVARLGAAGSLDEAFDPDTGAEGVVNAAAAAADGTVVIGGVFKSVGGMARRNVARLWPDGVVDGSFDSSAGPDGGVLCVALQNDGKVVIGGNFQTIEGVSRRTIARLNADGSLDSMFAPVLAMSVDVEEVYAIVVQPDGKLVVGGYFDHVNGSPRANLARLNPDGSLDPSFDPDLEVSAQLPLVLGLALQKDGKLLVVGSFDLVNGVARRGVARLSPDGQLDTDFNPGLGIDGGEPPEVSSLLVQLDGKVVIVGDFTTFDRVPCGNFARLNADGSLEASLVPSLGANGIVNAVSSQNGAGLILGGAFTSIGGQPRLGLARFDVVPYRLEAHRQNGSVVLTWEGGGRLQAADSLIGTWQEVPDSACPWAIPPTGAARFFRLVR
jgi:uncharacterized delta-60 repeat protein